MSSNDFRKKAIAAGVIVGMLGGAGVMSASANTNIFSGQSTPTTTASTTNTGSKTTNTTSNAKVEDVKTQSAGNNSGKANETVGSSTTRTVSGNNHAQAPDSKAKSSDSVADAVSGCDVAEHAEEVQISRIKAIEAGPSRVAAMESVEENEATKGCLSSSKEVLDLTLALPTIRGSWGDIGQIVRRQVDKEINSIKEQVINRTCEIADKAILDATAPVRDFYKTWNEAVNVINGADALVGKYLTDEVANQGTKVQSYLDGRLESLQNKLDARNKEISDKYEGYKSSLNDRVYESFGFNIEDADAQATKIRQEQVQAEIDDIQRRLPPQPKFTVRQQGGEYFKCDASGKCTATNVIEYQKITQETKAYNDAVANSKTQIAQLQKQIKDLGTALDARTKAAEAKAAGQTTTQATQTGTGTTTTGTQTTTQGTNSDSAANRTLSQRVDAASTKAKSTVNEAASSAAEKNLSVSSLRNMFTGSKSTTTEGESTSTGSNPFKN